MTGFFPPPVYSPDLCQCDFWFLGSAKEPMKDQTITNEEDQKTDRQRYERTLVETFFDQCPTSG
jgi:hypothetical protein